MKEYEEKNIYFIGMSNTDRKEFVSPNRFIQCYEK